MSTAIETKTFDLWIGIKNGYIFSFGYSQGAIWFYNLRAPQIHFRNFWDQKSVKIRLKRYVTMFTLFFWWIDCDAEISLDEVIAQVDHEKLRKCNFVMFCWPKKVFLVCTYTVYSTDSTMLRFQMRILMAKLNIKATLWQFSSSLYLSTT